MADDIDRTGADALDGARFRQVLGHFCTGVTIVTAMAGGDPVGFTAQSFSSVSLDPPLILLCPGKSSSTWPRIEEAGSFCVNILSNTQEALCRAFAAKGADKFAGVGWRPAPGTGAPLLEGGLAWLDCHIQQIHDAGDHLIVVARVLDLDVGAEGTPLLFYRGGYGSFSS